ncbi:hypothetical protein M378DRAFT_174319 [Amanita muscaria Koide BX008]|uniref:Uncharacterized protein n=1 Tax=Amanita muscaria (strain Koide BX008) TaxID=946122 RepID=A0A0C2WE21_AMAMK|nr:hypothetical protein M378DRAFT_174319 [Amanita muscaria Koide BX008]
MSENQNNQDSYQSQHRLQETNEPSQSARPTTTAVSDQPGSNTGIPPTGRHHDATLGRTGRTAGTGVDGQQCNTTQGRVDGQQYNTAQGRNAGNGVDGQKYNTTQGRSAETGQQYNTAQGRTAGNGVDGQQNNTTQGRTAGNDGVGGQQDNAPNAQGGAAMGGQSDLPIGYADMEDKIIGNAQKVIGKITENPELQKKGELRKSSGKAVVQGLARAAPHT